MGEKRGDTGKILYDFNTSAVLEVCIKGTWYRTTCREFRSFDGARRTTQPVKQPAQGGDFTNIEMITQDYLGPVYMYLTNLRVPLTNSQTIVRVPVIEKKRKKSC